MEELSQRTPRCLDPIFGLLEQRSCSPSSASVNKATRVIGVETGTLSIMAGNGVQPARIIPPRLLLYLLSLNTAGLNHPSKPTMALEGPQLLSLGSGIIAIVEDAPLPLLLA